MGVSWSGSRPSGASFGILHLAEIPSNHTSLDQALVGLGFLRRILPAGDQMLHEIKATCYILSNALDHDPKLTRYAHMPPLADTDLR